MKRMLSTLAILALAIFAFHGSAAANPGSYGHVLVNGQTLPWAVRAALAQRGTHVPAGRYWYDQRSGAWGLEGGRTRGFMQAGLQLGGPLRADASRGRSGVYINGRQLKHGEAQVLRRLLGRLARGSYWLDSHGNAGRVGGPALVNLRQLAARRGGGGRGGRSWLVRQEGIGGRGGIGVAGDGRTTCVSTANYTRCY
jgi:hypothetical protein